MRLNHRGLPQRTCSAPQAPRDESVSVDTPLSAATGTGGLMNLNASSKDGSGERPDLEEAAAYAALSQIAVVDRRLDQTLEEVAVLAQRALPKAPEASVTLV